MTTPGERDGWLVPPLWLEANGLTPEEFEAVKARFLAAVERGGPPKILGLSRRARLRLWLAGVRWWEWAPVQWWWYRQYKRADRRAFRRECAEIRWRAVWRSGAIES